MSKELELAMERLNILRAMRHELDKRIENARYALKKLQAEKKGREDERKKIQELKDFFAS